MTPLRPIAAAAAMAMDAQIPRLLQPAMDDFNESDHPRAENGQFGSGGGGGGGSTTPTAPSAKQEPAPGGRPLDHGELNIPGRTNNINAELDRYKAAQATEARTAAKSASEQKKVDKAAAKSSFSEHGETMVAKMAPGIAKRQGVSEKEAAKSIRETLDSLVKWEPAKFLKVVEKFKAEQAAAAQAHDELADMLTPIAQDAASVEHDRLAFDRATVRTFDADGRLHVSLTNISKATVNPYYGREIPDADSLGLDPDEIYMLLRDPEELEKAAATFNGLPLLSEHQVATAANHLPDLVIGATGTEAVFEAPYLKNSLVVWAADAIKRIESDQQRELSCAYRYRAVMEPGTFEGVQYDGRMTNLVGSHVAVVREGRAGPDVVVGDSALTTPTEKQPMKQPPTARALMARGALLRVADGNLLATDAKPDFAKLAAGVPAKGKAAPALLDAIKPHLAQDADIEEVRAILDLVDAVEEGGIESTVAEDDASPDAFLKGKLSDEDYAKYKELCAPAAQDEDDEAAKAAAAKKEEEDDDMDKKPGVTEQAMDAAIKTAVKAAEARATAAALKTARDIAEAHAAVRPVVGELHLAADSAADVYAAALKTLGEDTTGMEPGAYRHVFAAHAKAKAARPALAQDAAVAPSSDFATRFGAGLAVRHAA